MQGSNSSEPSRLPDSSRLIALTDGLFATVLTVLVLAFRLPEVENPQVSTSTAVFFQHLVDLSPNLLSYVLTFLVAGAYWQAHHRIFESIPRTDQRLIWYNLMFLLCVGLLPFTTQVVGTRTDAISWTMYCINMVLIGIMFTFEWGYAATHGLRTGDTSPRMLYHLLMTNLSTPGVFLASLIVVQFNARIAYYFPVLIPIARIAIGRIFPVDASDRERPLEKEGNALAELFWRFAIYFPLVLIAVWFYWISSFYHPAK